MLGDQNQYSTFAQGFQGSGSINLRGLGPTRTLVLLNGKRTFQSPGDGFVDTQLIPLFAIERVEILKDGAAATYGSDAIAGVANFITRQNFDGVELQGEYTFVPGSDGDYRVAALVGQDFGDVNIMFGAGYQHRSELPTTERDFAVRSFEENPSAYSAFATPGLFTAIFAGDNPATPDVTESFFPASRVDSGCEDVGGTLFGVCRFSFIPFNNIVEETERYQVFGSADVDLTDRLELHLEGLWARTELDSLNYSAILSAASRSKGLGLPKRL